MASYVNTPSIKAKHTERDEIYIAATPLRATKGPAQLLMSAAFSLNLLHLQHFMLIIKPSISPNSQAIVFDFQPQDPEDIYVAVSALSGKSVPGVILERKISRVPSSRCWYIGPAVNSNAVEVAYEFNSNWNTDLQIGHHDCRHYTNGLAEVLTGRKNVLEGLRTSVNV